MCRSQQSHLASGSLGCPTRAAWRSCVLRTPDISYYVRWHNIDGEHEHDISIGAVQIQNIECRMQNAEYRMQNRDDYQAAGSTNPIITVAPPLGPITTGPDIELPFRAVAPSWCWITYAITGFLQFNPGPAETSPLPPFD